MSLEDKMSEFAPGLAEVQVEFYRVADDGTVERWWIVPGTSGPTSHGPADGNPLGPNPRPGWYWRGGAPCECDPREMQV
mgnify:CR=1 FL=1